MSRAGESSRDETRHDIDARKVVVIVDDEEIVHANVRAMLRPLGCTVHSAFDGAAALQMLERLRCDVIITDLMMPLLDGIGLLAKLKERGLATPVVMITGAPTVRTALQAVRLGARDYVSKPFSRKELLGVLARAWRDTEPRAPSLPPPPLPALLPGAVLILPHHSWARFEQDGTFLIGIEQTFLDPVGVIRSATVVEGLCMLNQGWPGVVLINDRGESHSASMPLTGSVSEVNTRALDSPSGVTPGTWIFRIVPSDLASELSVLALRSP